MMNGPVNTPDHSAQTWEHSWIASVEENQELLGDGAWEMQGLDVWAKQNHNFSNFLFSKQFWISNIEL